MLSAVFLFGITLASIVIASTSASFPRCISCPCGTGSQNYTHCLEESLIKDFSCERWSQCETCKANRTFCITCPPNRFGPTCSENSLTRRKRQDEPDLLSHLRYRRQSGTCPFLEGPESGSIRCSQTGNERNCTSRCLPGFYFEGEENVNEITLRCLRNVWTPRSSFPPCKSGGHCEVEVTGTGFYNCTTDMEGAHCDVTCDGQYQGKFHCYPGRSWNQPLPYCTAPKVETQSVTCADPGIPRNGRRINPDRSDALDSRTFQEGESVVFTCDVDFALSGSSFMTCLTDGTWSSPRPQCVSIRVVETKRAVCDDPGIPSNGRRINPDGSDALDSRTFQEGESVNFSCDVDFALDGSSSSTCLADGTWSAPRPLCIVIRLDTPSVGEGQLCPFPEVDPNGEVKEFLLDPKKLKSGFESGTELTIQCKEGYVLQAWGFIYCKGNGQWTTPSPKCNAKPRSNSASLSLIRCLNPGRISNGRVDVFPAFGDSVKDDDFEFPLGTHLKFSCEDGFSLVGEEDSINCESNGYWSGSIPMCAKD